MPNPLTFFSIEAAVHLQCPDGLSSIILITSEGSRNTINLANARLLNAINNRRRRGKNNTMSDHVLAERNLEENK